MGNGLEEIRTAKNRPRTTRALARSPTTELLLSPLMIQLVVFNQFQKAMGGSPVGGVGVEFPFENYRFDKQLGEELLKHVFGQWVIERQHILAH